MPYSEEFREQEFEPFMNCVRGSMYWRDLSAWGRETFRQLRQKFPLRRQLKPSWRTRIDGNLYPELWVRYYALLRHHAPCMAYCSDCANRVTQQELPIVRDSKLDLKLLLAHAQIQHWVRARKKQTKKGQNDGQQRSNRNAKKEMAGR